MTNSNPTPQSSIIGRVVLTAMLGLLALFCGTAQSSPPLTVIVPYPPGGFTDVVTRRMTTQLAQVLERPVVVENRPGAGTNLGAEAVANAKPDGNTLFMGTSSLAINPSLYGKQLRYNALTSFKSLGIFATTGYVLVASPSLPANNISELVALAKREPNKLTFASSGNGSVNHLAGELFKTQSGTQIMHVPYRGAQQAINDLVGGQVDLYFSSVLDAKPLIQAGRIKALGTSAPAAHQQLNNVPLISDSVPGFNVEFWMGLFAPAGTPSAELQKLEAAVKQVVTDKKFHDDLHQRDVAAVYLAPPRSSELLTQDVDRWGAVVRKANAQRD